MTLRELIEELGMSLSDFEVSMYLFELVTVHGGHADAPVKAAALHCLHSQIKQYHDEITLCVGLLLEQLGAGE